MHLDQPNVAIWVDDVAPNDFIETAVKVVRTGGGKPMFLGAKSRINHFKTTCGLTDEMAGKYDSVCCSFMWPPYLPNMDHAADINPGIALEYVFTNGKDRKTGVQVGPQTGDPRKFRSIDEIYSALVQQIEQHAPAVRSYYFRSDSCRDDDYRKAMNELTSFSFTVKNVHDDAADSLAMLADYLSNGIKTVSVGKRPF